MGEIREYQEKAVREVREKWEGGKKSVLLVAPTGAGKTRMCEDMIGGGEPSLWVAHRRDLVEQTFQRLEKRFGIREVGMIMPGAYENRKARIQIATVQTLLSRGDRPDARIVVLDEGHHYVARDWKLISESYPKARCVGATATPERADGTPLEDVYDDMVVASSYAQLMVDGHLVGQVALRRPDHFLGSDLAEDPFEAWKEVGARKAFIFCPRVEIAKAVAKRFNQSGNPLARAAVLDASTPASKRSDVLAKFRRGEIRVIANDNILTEGIDVPDVECIILARSFLHRTQYVQAAGRGLRATNRSFLGATGRLYNIVSYWQTTVCRRL